MNFQVRIVQGQAAHGLLNSQRFIHAWDKLARADKKTTLNQEFAFVSIWYQQYVDVYTPILCLGVDDTNAIVGLIPLALHKKSGTLTHAGAGQAEYHGWIAAGEIDQEFIVESIVALYQTLELDRWDWRWLPPGAPTAWMDSEKLRKAGVHAICMKQRSPLLDLLDDSKVARISRNKSVRWKILKFEYRDDLRLERVSTTERAKELLPILASQCDFRQAAINDTTPFRSDSNKLRFFEQRMTQPESNHFTVLWLGDRPIAFHFGACDRERVLLGLTSFDPIESRYSPGMVLITMLIALLVEEGYRYYDLTPGENSYKDRFASLQEPVCMPTFVRSGSARFQLETKERLRRWAKWIQRRFGVQEKLIARLRRVARNPALVRDRKALEALFDVDPRKQVRAKRIYRWNPAMRDSSSKSGLPIHKQAFEHLFRFTGAVDLNVFLLEAMNRFQQGDVLYSRCCNGILAQFAWLEGLNENSRLSTFIDSPSADSVLVYHIYTHPEYRDRLPYEEMISHIVDDQRAVGARSFYVAVQKDFEPVSRSLEKLVILPQA